MLEVKHLLADKGHRVFAIGPDEPVLVAVRMMADHYIGALLVMRDDELVGIVSERDYARKIILQNRSSAETPVRDIMSSPVVTVRPNDTTDTCMRICTERRVRHLPGRRRQGRGRVVDRGSGQGGDQCAVAGD